MAGDCALLAKRYNPKWPKLTLFSKNSCSLPKVFELFYNNSFTPHKKVLEFNMYGIFFRKNVVLGDFSIKK
jgi:hypothetical protein